MTILNEKERTRTEQLTQGDVEIRASSPLFYEYFSHILPYFTFIFNYGLRSRAILFGFILLLWSHLLT